MGVGDFREVGVCASERQRKETSPERDVALWYSSVANILDIFLMSQVFSFL